MTTTEALGEIRNYAAAGRIITGYHAAKRMQERGVSRKALRHALMTATGCEQQPNERWRVRGADLDGDELTVIAVIEDGVVVGTVF